jgi:hypothetical protein
MKYNTPEVNIVLLDNSDIITDSFCKSETPGLSIGDFDDILRGDFGR